MSLFQLREVSLVPRLCGLGSLLKVCPLPLQLLLQSRRGSLGGLLLDPHLAKLLFQLRHSAFQRANASLCGLELALHERLCLVGSGSSLALSLRLFGGLLVLLLRGLELDNAITHLAFLTLDFPHPRIQLLLLGGQHLLYLPEGPGALLMAGPRALLVRDRLVRHQLLLHGLELTQA